MGLSGPSEVILVFCRLVIPDLLHHFPSISTFVSKRSVSWPLFMVSTTVVQNNGWAAIFIRRSIGLMYLWLISGFPFNLKFSQMNYLGSDTVIKPKKMSLDEFASFRPDVLFGNGFNICGNIPPWFIRDIYILDQYQFDVVR